MRLDPDNPEAHNNHALILAACPRAEVLDGRKAVESATRACDLTHWDQPACLDTLAAAYAEAGDFRSAVAWQTRAIERLGGHGDPDDYRSRLELYQAGKPYLEPFHARPATAGRP